MTGLVKMKLKGTLVKPIISNADAAKAPKLKLWELELRKYDLGNGVSEKESGLGLCTHHWTMFYCYVQQDGIQQQLIQD